MACNHLNRDGCTIGVDDVASSQRPGLWQQRWGDRLCLLPRIGALKQTHTVASPLDHVIPKNTRLQRWLKIDPVQKPKIYAQIYDDCLYCTQDCEAGISSGHARRAFLLRSVFLFSTGLQYENSSRSGRSALQLSRETGGEGSPDDGRIRPINGRCDTPSAGLSRGSGEHDREYQASG
jgi:hypothetical protein